MQQQRCYDDASALDNKCEGIDCYFYFKILQLCFNPAASRRHSLLVSTKLKRETSYDLKGMFGIKSRIEQVESLLSINAWQGVCTVGIHGMGGIGKTTLAKAVFKRLSSKFKACCFLSNVREKAEQTDGVNQLKKTLLRDILKEENLSIDSTSVRKRLGRTMVLIVFDDVSDWKQIKDVAGDNLRYGDGSGIMVTSRERRRVLKKAVSYEKYIYEVKKIKTDDALQLFQFHAFKDNSPREEYAELSERVVEYAGGIPLALEVLGSLFFECESKGEWEDAWRTLRNYPNEEIQNTFRGTEKVQAIFLTDSHIEERDLDHANFGKMYNLRVLHVSISSYEEHFHTLSLPNSLRYLYWGFYPLKSLPPTFSLENLVELRMFNGQVMQLWNGKQNPMNLKVITLHLSEHLTTLPNLSKSIEHINLEGCKGLVTIPLDFQYLDKLTYLDLGGCKSLKNLPEMPGNIEVLCLRGSGIEQLPSSVWSHEKICSLDIEYCTELEKLPRSSCKLKVSGAFSLKGCYSLGEVWELPRGIGELDFSHTAIEVLPASSMECLLCLTTLKLKDCKNLASLPPSIYKLKSLEVLDLTGCTGFYNFPEILEPMEHLEFLSLKGTAVKELPPSIEFLFALKEIQLKDCKNLASLPPSICKLKSPEGLDLTGCTGFYKFPEILEPIEHLEFLHLADTAVEELPQSFGNLIGLQTLNIWGSDKLKVVPSCIYKLTNLKTLIISEIRELNFPQPPSPVGLLSLEVLDLRFSGILEIPEYLVSLTSLWDINLRGTNIRSIPSSRGGIFDPTH